STGCLTSPRTLSVETNRGCCTIARSRLPTSWSLAYDAESWVATGSLVEMGYARWLQSAAGTNRADAVVVVAISITSVPEFTPECPRKVCGAFEWSRAEMEKAPVRRLSRHPVKQYAAA